MTYQELKDDLNIVLLLHVKWGIGSVAARVLAHHIEKLVVTCR